MAESISEMSPIKLTKILTERKVEIGHVKEGRIHSEFLHSKYSDGIDICLSNLCYTLLFLT